MPGDGHPQALLRRLGQQTARGSIDFPWAAAQTVYRRLTGYPKAGSQQCTNLPARLLGATEDASDPRVRYCPTSGTAADVDG